MTKEAKKILKQYQCDYNRSIEENFAQVLTENDAVRLFFVNEGQPFTDGRNIIVDPAIGGVFADEDALRRAEDYLQIKHDMSTDPWHALRMITRAHNIHESLHIIYSSFPNGACTDSRATTKARKKALSSIDNIIEDAFIEAVGCSVYDNLELFLQFERVATFFSNTPVESTVNRVFKEEINNSPEPLPFIIFQNYMGIFLLYPMFKQKEPPECIAEYVESTKQLFLDGSICGNPDERYKYTQKIFDIIEPIVPESEEDIDDEWFCTMLPGHKTHGSENQTIGSHKSTGKTVEVTRRLFSDLDGNALPKGDFAGQAMAIIDEFTTERNAALEIIMVKPVTITWVAAQFDCASIHKNIKIIETKPKPNLNLRKAYQNIYSKYQISINSYNSRFTQILQARIPMREEKKLFGSGISSNRLGDVKKRYWYRSVDDIGVPDIAIMLLIDGSGSMSGQRRYSAMISSVILHEVLKKQGIAHTIVEHRAGFGNPLVKVNILVGINARNEEKYNLMTISANGDNRDGFALYWAEKYLNTYTNCAQKLIILLADGAPAHAYDEYYSPISTEDTASAASKIIKRGTDIIAVALDDGTHPGHSCYNSLKRIYPSVISCTDLNRLTGQLLNIVSKNLQ